MSNGSSTDALLTARGSAGGAAGAVLADACAGPDLGTAGASGAPSAAMASARSTSHSGEGLSVQRMWRGAGVACVT